jgi:hypothetical protein
MIWLKKFLASACLRWTAGLYIGAVRHDKLAVWLRA